MPTVTRFEITEYDLFKYAEKYFDIGWNDCCDIFGHTMFNGLDGRSYVDVYREDSKGELEFMKTDTSEKSANGHRNHQWHMQALTIVIAYMTDKKKKEMRIMLD